MFSYSSMALSRIRLLLSAPPLNIDDDGNYVAFFLYGNHGISMLFIDTEFQL